MTEPLTPKDALAVAHTSFPDGVIEVWNELIQKNLRGKRATIKQDDAARALARKFRVPQQKVYDNDWLDIEDVYRKAGWRVRHDKPGYDESYAAYFEFTAP
jgi:hypothetical protein